MVRLGYNYNVRSHPFLQNTLILVTLLALVVAPPSIAGFADLNHAHRLEETGHYTDAAFAYVSAARRLPWQSRLWEWAGISMLAAGNPGQAMPYFETAIARAGLSQDGWLAYGDAAQQNGDLLHALKAWEQALPSSKAYRRLARLQRQQGHLDSAMTNWRGLLAVEPDDAEAHFSLGLLLAATSPEQALPELTRAAQLDSTLDEAVHTLRTSLNMAAAQDGQEIWFFQAGLGLAALQAWDLAQAAFKNAIDLQPDYAEAWAWLGEARQQVGLDGGVQIREALKLKQAAPVVQLLYGLYLQRQGQPAQALSVFWTAVSLEPQEAAWRAALAGAYEQTGDLVEALKHYQYAVQLAPQEAAYWRALAIFCLRNSVDVAGVGLPAARKVVELAPQDWQSYDIAGQTLLEVEDPIGAEVLLEKAIAMAPQQAEPYLHLGQVYLETGNDPAAYDALMDARNLDPTGSIGWQAQRLLDRYFP